MNNMGVFNPPKKKNMKVIALSTMCVVLAAGLVGVLALYLSRRKPFIGLRGTDFPKRKHH